MTVPTDDVEDITLRHQTAIVKRHKSAFLNRTSAPILFHELDAGLSRAARIAGIAEATPPRAITRAGRSNA